MKDTTAVRANAFSPKKEQTEDKICPVHNLPLEWVEEDNYFFALSKYQDPLIKHIHENPDFIQPESRRQRDAKRVRVRVGGCEHLKVFRILGHSPAVRHRTHLLMCGSKL